MSGEKINNDQWLDYSEWDSLSDFDGERNINSATGKPRSFTTMDVYPRRAGETAEEYGSRIKAMNEKIAQFQAEEAEKEAKNQEEQAKRAYLESDQGRQEKEIEAKFDNLSDKLDQAVSEGRMSEEHAKALLEKELERSTNEIEGIRQDYEDRQTVGPEEDQIAYQEWFEKRGVDTSAPELSETQEVSQDPEISNVPLLTGPVLEEKNQVDLGEEETIKNIEAEIDEDKIERLEKLEEKLNKLRPNMAELYAKNRRLIVGAENRAAFTKAKGEYEELLDESLKLKAETTYEAGKSEIAEKLASRVDELNQQIQNQLLEFVGGDPENTDKTQEEVDAERSRLIDNAEKTLRAEYKDMVEKLESEVNANFVEDYINEQVKLEEATIDKLDKGNLCRKFVDKVINNKALKVALIAAGAIGLAVTGVGIGAGLAAGTMSVGLGYTAGGVALGAGKGALMGGLMSRQNSKNSAVRGFASEEEIRNQLEGVNALSQDGDSNNVASWLLEQYSEAKDTDASSNKKRTAVAVGLGAALGGIMSGVQINNIVDKPIQVTEQVSKGGNYDVDLSKINLERGDGMYRAFDQLGIDSSRQQEALEIMRSLDSRYGMVPGSNSVTSGLNGGIGEFAHTYPGSVESWPDVVQSYWSEGVQELAKQGIIDAPKAEPVFDIVTKMTTESVPDAFHNFLTRNVVALSGAGVIGAEVGNRGRRLSVDEAVDLRTDEPAISPAEILPESGVYTKEAIDTKIAAFEAAEQGNTYTKEAIDTKIAAFEMAEQGNTRTREAIDAKIAAFEAAEQGGNTYTKEDYDTKIAAFEAAEQGNTYTKEDFDAKIAAFNAVEPETDNASYEERLNRRREQIASINNWTDENILSDETDYNFWNSIGEEGLEIITDNGELNDEKSNRIQSWWNNLSTQTRDSLLIEQRNEIGNTLATWLINQGILPESERINIEAPIESQLADQNFNAEAYVNNEIEERNERARSDYRFWNGIGPEGLEIITDPERPIDGDGKIERIANWWNTLDEPTKREVFSRYRNSNTVGARGIGRALNVWLNMHSENTLF